MEILLSWLLGSTWVAGTLPILIASIPSSRLNSFNELLLGFANRGKIMESSSSSSHKFRVPQRFFLHFYLMGAVWTTFLLMITWHFAYKLALLGSGSLDYPAAATSLMGGSHISFYKPDFSSADNRYRIWVSVFMLLLMEIHVFRRLYETAYVFKYSPSARMHIFGYLTGLYFYTAAPLSLCHFCVFEALNVAEYRAIELNIKKQEVSAIDFDWWGYMKPIMNLGCIQWIGAAIFAWGWVHQQRCHAILGRTFIFQLFSELNGKKMESLSSFSAKWFSMRCFCWSCLTGSLRGHREQDDNYVIPHGDWFEWVSSPHYFAEMIIYSGILVASGGTDFIIWLLVVFVVANLTFAAAETHRWYLRKFEDYPRNRWAVLPFIY